VLDSGKSEIMKREETFNYSGIITLVFHFFNMVKIILRLKIAHKNFPKVDAMKFRDYCTSNNSYLNASKSSVKFELVTSSLYGSISNQSTKFNMLREFIIIQTYNDSMNLLKIQSTRNEIILLIDYYLLRRTWDTDGLKYIKFNRI